MVQEIFETNLFLSSSCQVHSENGFEKLCNILSMDSFEKLSNIFSMKHIRRFLVLHRWWALVVKSVRWSAPEILKFSSHKQTALLKAGNSSIHVGFGQNQPHLFIIYTEKFTAEISHADGYQNVDFSEVSQLQQQHKEDKQEGFLWSAHPGLETISRRTRTASSLLMFSKLTSFTWNRKQRSALLQES